MAAMNEERLRAIMSQFTERATAVQAILFDKITQPGQHLEVIYDHTLRAMEVNLTQYLLGRRVRVEDVWGADRVSIPKGRWACFLKALGLPHKTETVPQMVEIWHVCPHGVAEPKDTHISFLRAEGLGG